MRLTLPSAAAPPAPPLQAAIDRLAQVHYVRASHWMDERPAGWEVPAGWEALKGQLQPDVSPETQRFIVRRFHYKLADPMVTAAADGSLARFSLQTTDPDPKIREEGERALKQLRAQHDAWKLRQKQRNKPRKGPTPPVPPRKTLSVRGLVPMTTCSLRSSGPLSRPLLYAKKKIHFNPRNYYYIRGSGMQAATGGTVRTCRIVRRQVGNLLS